MFRFKLFGVIAVLALFSPIIVMAHPGHGATGFASGLAHPLSGLDHLLAMLAVGIWAALSTAAARWLIPTSFVVAMTAGGVLASSGVHLPLVESGIFASVLVLGFILLFALRLPTAVGAGLAALFAMFHGYAHGAEMPAGAAALSYSTGFLLATMSLLFAGVGIGTLLRAAKQPVWARAIGGGIVAASLLLAMGRL